MMDDIFRMWNGSGELLPPYIQYFAGRFVSVGGIGREMGWSNFRRNKSIATETGNEPTTIILTAFISPPASVGNSKVLKVD